MRRVAVVGAGQIGDLIVTLLSESKDYEVSLFDASETQLARVSENANVRNHILDVTESAELERALARHQVVVNAAPYNLTETIATAAATAGAHYIDLTEDVASTRAVRKLAKAHDTAFIPQCGLAPGMVSILAASLASEFDELDTVKLRVGALPRYPSNTLSYNLTWSPAGVVNEYCNPCTVIFDGRRLEAPPLEQREHLLIDGVKYESFNTSGGLGSLASTCEGRVRNLSYQSIRYPGHAAIMRTLLRDLGLSNRQGLLLDIFGHSLPVTSQDVVIIFITVTGKRGDRLEQLTYTNKSYGKRIAGREFTAIQLTTASSACAVLDLLATGAITQRGFIRQEDIALDAVLGNRFGQVFATNHTETEQLASVA